MCVLNSQSVKSKEFLSVGGWCIFRKGWYMKPFMYNITFLVHVLRCIIRSSLDIGILCMIPYQKKLNNISFFQLHLTFKCFRCVRYLYYITFKILAVAVLHIYKCWQRLLRTSCYDDTRFTFIFYHECKMQTNQRHKLLVNAKINRMIMLLHVLKAHIKLLSSPQLTRSRIMISKSNYHVQADSLSQSEYLFYDKCSALKGFRLHCNEIKQTLKIL